MAEVTFGLFDWIDRSGAPLQQLYEERLRLLEAAEEAGFYAYHLAEHHATPLGMASSPERVPGGGGAAHQPHPPGAARLHPAALQPPAPDRRDLHARPSLGRAPGARGRARHLAVRAGVLRRRRTTRPPAPSSTRRWTVILTGLTHERLDFEGRHFRYRDVPMELRPLQRPYPPLWYPTQTPASVDQIARHGYNFVRLGPAGLARQPVAEYWRTWEAHKDDIGPAQRARGRAEGRASSARSSSPRPTPRRRRWRRPPTPPGTTRS